MVPLKMQIPWWAKLSTKLVLARLPLGYAAWRKLPIFKHGFMAEPEYAYATFRKHFDPIDLPNGFVSLELGPGDSLFSAFISYALGGAGGYLVDTGAYAVEAVEPYHQMARFLTARGYDLPSFNNETTLAALLKTVSTQYLTNGLNSLKQIPSESVDFIWSNAVLEHIRRKDFRPVMQELHRILKPNGICSHEIDLRDHLGGELNNLRFSSHWWEQDWVANSGFYTNRIRYSELLDILKETRYHLADLQILETWENVPTAKSKMASEFRQFTEDDLRVAVFSVTLNPI